MAASTLVDLVQVSTATTGTGTITLGSAVAHFRGSSALTDGATYDYRISDGASDYEIGSGVYTASGTTLTRVPLYSSNADAAVSLSGQATVTITALSASLLAISAPQTGDIKLATTAPTGWLPCEGAVYTKASYAALAALLGSIPGDYTWTARTVTGVTAPSVYAYAAGLFVAAGDLGSNLATSPDGVTWTARTANCGSGALTLCAGTSRLVVFTSGSTAIASSTDGLTYTARTIGANVSYMAFGNSVFVAVGTSGALYTSADGDTWTSRTAPNSGTYVGLIFFNGYFYAWLYGAGNTTMYRSADGIAWTARPFRAPTASQPSLRVQPGGYVTWNINGALYSSVDMENWVLQTGAMMPGGVHTPYQPVVAGGLAQVLSYPASLLYTSPEYDFTPATQFRTPDLSGEVPQALQGKAKFYMKAA